jgi:prevent-host-death family protein
MEVSVRELKANLSAVLRDVAKGQTATITSHRKPVARLLPPDPVPGDGLAALVKAGALTLPRRSGGLAPRKLLPLPPGVGSLSQAVIEDRG